MSGILDFQFPRRPVVLLLAFFLMRSVSIGQNGINIQPFSDPVCLGNSVSLNAIVTNTDYGTDSYSFHVIRYPPLGPTIGTPIDPT
ncbi:MAG: hypothetical protein WCJ95_21625, partial [Mariniphaga sp.]